MISWVLLIALLGIFFQLDAIRRNTNPLVSDEERRARRAREDRWSRFFWGRRD
jgi:hypothetical protein